MLVFAAAKAAMLAGHRVEASWWSPAAYLWQDAAVVLFFAAVEWRLSRCPRIVWLLYAALALYAAINIPVARALATPLTWPMWRAAGGPLADSIRYYATWQNTALVLAVMSLA